jgi:hypothetical protein
MINQSAFSECAGPVLEFIRAHSAVQDPRKSGFERLALEVFEFQFAHNAAYRRFCEARHATPGSISDWRSIPAVPTVAFKEWDLTCLPETERTRVFNSSGSTGHRPSRHHHNAESLALYEASLLPWFESHLLSPASEPVRWAMLTPSPEQAPHSSLAHMLGTAARRLAGSDWAFMGELNADGAWELDSAATIRALKEACVSVKPVLLMGTAFNFVHLLDDLEQKDLPLRLPVGSRAMETGGYKGRSRALPRGELHAQITERLGLPPDGIVSEYGMSELSSQAYDRSYRARTAGPRVFRFPPWARSQIVSPETGLEVGEGETGLIRVTDLANVYSAMVVQTEDLCIRRGDGFELIGRAALAEQRGCSLMSA